MPPETRVDLHVKVADEAVVARAKRRGLDVLVYAPHFTRWPTIVDRAAALSDDDLLVVPARELFTGTWHRRRHVLALDLDRPVPDFLTLEGTFAELARQDAVILVPHPAYLTVSLDRSQIRTYLEHIDGVETVNPKYLPWHTSRARAIARDLDLPPFASSYAHLPGTVGEAWTSFQTRMETEEDLLEALRTGESRRAMRRSGPGHVGRRIGELAHLAYENSWQKFERVFLSGTEPTHPGHVAYDGAFDEWRVY